MSWTGYENDPDYGFTGGVDFARDSAGIIEPPKDFPASGTACFGCPGVNSSGCCQHVQRGLVIRVAVPCDHPDHHQPPKTERAPQKRRLFGRRTRT